jgi:hypothetical protein
VLIASRELAPGQYATTAAMLSGTHAFDAQPWPVVRRRWPETVVLMCLMTGYADGRLSAAERAMASSFATT